MSEMGQGRLRPQVDGTAGLPSAPEMRVCPVSYAWCHKRSWAPS